MEIINIKVTKKLASDWDNAPIKLREEIQKSFQEQIKRLLHQSKLTKFDNLLNMVREEAEMNGLTENELQNILKADA